MIWWPIASLLTWLADPVIGHQTVWDKPFVSEIQAACADAGAGPVERVMDGQVLCLTGRTDVRMRAAFLALGDDPLSGVEVVHIISEGGALGAALDIAEPIADAGVAVIAGGMCISSCAQFIFMAGSPKIIAPGAIVAMHGGPIRLERLTSGEFDAEAERSLLRESLRFYEFYDRLNVDIDIVKSPPPHILERIHDGEIVFWTVDPEDYPRFGVHDLIVFSPDPKDTEG